MEFGGLQIQMGEVGKSLQWRNGTRKLLQIEMFKFLEILNVEGNFSEAIQT